MLCVAEVETHFCSERHSSHAGDRSVHKMETSLANECHGAGLYPMRMHQAAQQDPPVLGAKNTVPSPVRPH